MIRQNEITTLLRYSENYILVTPDSTYLYSNLEKKQKVMLENQRNDYNGFMSPATLKKVKKIITLWADAVTVGQYYQIDDSVMHERKLSFVTLTLSQSQFNSDNEIKRAMLDPFLIKIKRDFKVKYFFWKAEKQKNGRIHFHVIVDAFIPKEKIQRIWNVIQNRNGYLVEFRTKFSRNNPPSTHVRSIDNSSMAISYILKYIGKKDFDTNNEKMKVNGRIWGCSSELKELKPYTSCENKAVISWLYQAVSSGKVEMFQGDFFTIFKLDVKGFLQAEFPEEYANWCNIMAENYNSLYLSEPISKFQNATNIKKKSVPISAEKQLKIPLSFELTSNYESLRDSSFFD